MASPIDELIARSSVGEGLRWTAFGLHLRESRLRFRVKVSLLCRLSGLSESRVRDIESGAPPFARRSEVEAYAKGLGISPSSLKSRMPK